MGFPVVGCIKKCGTCGRSILVERGLFGVDHTAGTFVTCWDCLTEKTKKKAMKKYKVKP